MVRLAWRMVRQRPASMVATFLALAFAVAMVTTCGVTLESGVRFHGTVARYAGAPVLVATTQLKVSSGSGEDREVEGQPLAERAALPAGLIDRIRTAAGVSRAIGDVAVPARAGAGAQAVDAVEVHPWPAAALAPFRLVEGHAPAAGEVVLDRALAGRLQARAGQRIRLTLPAGPRPVTVAGIAATTGTRPGHATVFVDDRDPAVAGAPQVIAVLPVAGVRTSDLARAVARTLPDRPEPLAGAYPQVFTGAARGSVESTDVDGGREFVIALSAVFGGSTLLIAAFVISGTVGLSVRQRHRDIALLRAIAATPRQVRRMVVREAVGVGVLAGAAGVWPGLAGASWLADRFVARGLTPPSFTVRISWLPPVVAVAAGLLVAGLAAWVASRRASRIRPTEALAETAVERRGIGPVRLGLGVIALAGGIVLCFVSAAAGENAPGVAIGTVVTLVLSVALMNPLLLRALCATVGRLGRLFGAPGRLAVANAAASANKLSAVVGSVVLAVALGGSLWFLLTSEEHVARQQTRAGVRADLVVVPRPPGLSAADEAALRRVDGVETATRLRHGTLFATDSGPNGHSAQGVDVAGLAGNLDLGVRAGDLGKLHGDTVALDRLTADALDLSVGERFRGWFADGTPARLRVVAVYDRGLGFASMTLARDELARHGPASFDDAVFVRVTAGRGVENVRAELARAVPGATVLDRAQYRVGLDKDLAANAWANRVLVAVLLGYVVLAALNTLIMYVLARRREFGVLRLAGTTPRQVRQMVALEQVLLLGFALVVGAAVAAATLIPMVKGTTGSATPYVPLGGWIAAVGGVVALGVVGTAVPARRALHAGAVEAVGIRE